MGPAGYPPPPDLLGLVSGVAAGGQVAGGASQQLVLHGTLSKPSEASDDDSDSSDDSDNNGQPPKEIGDVDPSRCKVSGPGFSGAAAGMPVQLYLYAHDAYGRRLRSGGDEVVVRVSPASSSMALAAPIEVTVVDNDNGTYTATYTPPMKGNYFLSVDVNYLPITGSPFPVFFSNPLDPAEAAAAAAAAAAGPAPAGGLTPPPGSTDPAVMAMAAAAKQAISGAVAQSDSALRTIHVTNMSASVSVDQYRQLFSIPGKIMDIKQAGEGTNAMLIIEYGTVPEAEEAAKMNGMAVGDRSLVVQNGVVYKATASSLAAIAAPPAASQTPQETLDALQVVVPSVVPTLPMPMVGMPGLPGMPLSMPGLGMGLGMGLPPTDPLMAMQQLQQMQELQRIQSQMEANKQLAEQVARMRALARTSKGNGRNPDEERLKATDAVMERLNRKLGAMGDAAGGGAGSRRSRSRSSSSSSGSSRSRSRGRRDRSRDRRRSRSRSRDRRDRERRDRERREQERRDRERKERERREMERRESERRERDRRERDQRERERRDRERERDRDRRRDSSRDRKRDGSRERRRDGSRDRIRESSRDRKRDCSKDRKARSKRSRSRTPEQARERDSKRDERKREVSEGPAGGPGKAAEPEQRQPDAPDVAEVHPAEDRGKQAETNGHGAGDDPVLPSNEADGKDKDRDESPDREKGSRRRDRDERKRDKKERKERRKEKKSKRDKGERDDEEGDDDKHAASDGEAAAPGVSKVDV